MSPGPRLRRRQIADEISHLTDQSGDVVVLDVDEVNGEQREIGEVPGLLSRWQDAGVEG